MYSDLMKCTMKMNYNGIYIHIYMYTQFAQNLVTHMKLINFLHEIFAHIELHFVPKVNMIIKDSRFG